ncbi:MAG: DUF4338 domain-containing protein [Pseudonocardia sp.]|nr:DUF4338 domain-containing protein [Pseudonocardia sp.]
MGTSGRRAGAMTGTEPDTDPAGPVRYCGRVFSPADLDTIRALAGRLPTRRAIADAVCDALGWTRPDGRRKDMSARVALNRMHEAGLIVLPAPRNGNGNGRHARHSEPESQPTLPVHPTPLAGSLADLGALHLTPVTTRADSARYTALIRAHHYLGYTPLAGAQRRYLVHAEHHDIVAVLAFAAAAWTCAPRDSHIGWDPATRARRLHLIAGNARFLILPHLHVPNLASTILARAARTLAADWQATYGYTPVLLETFVETGRFTAASYRAANWIHAGQTQGRGKLDRNHHHALPVKDIYLYPLHRNYRHILTTPD